LGSFDTTEPRLALARRFAELCLYHKRTNLSRYKYLFHMIMAGPLTLGRRQARPQAALRAATGATLSGRNSAWFPVDVRSLAIIAVDTHAADHHARKTSSADSPAAAPRTTLSVMGPDLLAAGIYFPNLY